MKTKQQAKPTPSKVSGKSPSDRRQADRTAANKAKRKQNLFSAPTDKPDYRCKNQRTMQYQRDPCDVVEMFYLGTRATMH